jgi:hypothetical protein
MALDSSFILPISSFDLRLCGSKMLIHGLCAGTGGGRGAKMIVGPSPVMWQIQQFSFTGLLAALDPETYNPDTASPRSRGMCFAIRKCQS